MLTVVAVSDTHLPGRARDLPGEVWEAMAAADLAIHAGDWVEPALLDAMEHRCRRLIACWGNNDGAELRARLPETATATLEDVRLVVTHETGPAAGRGGRVDRAHAGADVVIFGHSHIPWDSVSPGGIRLLNPGSPTDRRRQPHASYLTWVIDAGRLAEVTLHPLPSRDGGG